MKIVCLIASLRLGGAERQMAGLASALKGAGHQVSVLTYRDGDFYEKSLTDSGVEHLRIRSGSTSGIVSEIAEYVKQSDTEILISFLTGSNVKACLVGARCPGLRVIVSERTTNLRLGPHDIFRFLLYRKRADAVVCNNHSQEEFIRKAFPSLAKKVRTIPNFVDLTGFTPASGRRNGAGPVKIVVTARVCPRKNVTGLILAARELLKIRKDFRIDWYGMTREDAYFRKCRKMIDKLGLKDLFAIHEAASDVENIYRNSDIFCLPSFYEGTSNSLAEALASGLPAVCSRVGDNTGYVKEGFDGFLFDPHDPRSMAAAIDRALDSDLASLGASGRKIAEEHLCIDNFRKSYLELVAEKKRIAALTMVRNGMPFIEKWIRYYGTLLGKENIYVFLDGADQHIPDWCRDACNLVTVPEMSLPIVEGDRARARFISRKAADLFKDGYDIVIGTDIDEFIIPDPSTGKDLPGLLSGLKGRTCVSPLGIDIFQRDGEADIDSSKDYLSQRHYAWLCPGYTKASIIFRPCVWGSGFHRVKRHNYHICKDLYLFHLGYSNNRNISEKIENLDLREKSWKAHLNRRLSAVRKCNGKKPQEFDAVVGKVRFAQRVFRCIYALNKPSLFGQKVVVHLPDRFEGIV